LPSITRKPGVAGMLRAAAAAAERRVTRGVARGVLWEGEILEGGLRYGDGRRAYEGAMVVVVGDVVGLLFCMDGLVYRVMRLLRYGGRLLDSNIRK
jgi:hypothetical protein